MFLCSRYQPQPLHCDCSAAAITWTLGGAAALLHLLHVCSETRLKLRGSDSESAVKMRAGVRIHLLAVKEWKPDSHQQVRSGVRGNSSASPLFRIEKKLAASCPGGATSSCPPAWRQPPLVSRSQSSEIVQPHDCFKWGDSTDTRPGPGRWVDNIYAALLSVEAFISPPQNHWF